MDIKKLVSAAVVAVVVTATMSLFALGVFAQTPNDVEPVSNQRDEDDDAGEDEEPDIPVLGDALEQASAAALEYVGEGVVTDTEVGDEDGYYEIEVRLDDGTQIDVHLDEYFNVLGQEID